MFCCGLAGFKSIVNAFLLAQSTDLPFFSLFCMFVGRCSGHWSDIIIITGKALSLLALQNRWFLIIIIIFNKVNLGESNKNTRAGGRGARVLHVEHI